MPLYTVNQLKAALGGGAKTDKFTIEFGAPSGDSSLTLGTDGPILCISTNFPSKSIESANAFIQGRPLKLAMDTSFEETWTVTFYNTPDHSLRKMFIAWTEFIDSFSKNKHNCNPDSYMVTAKVMQLNCDGNASATYEFINMWPSRIEEVEVNGEENNSIEKFAVVFTYSYWEVVA